jgi:integrase
VSIHSRRLRGGRVVYDVRLRTPDGTGYKRTFRTRKEAELFEANERADQAKGTWSNPLAGKVPFGEYATSWLDHRPNLRPRTIELYRSQLRRHLLPAFGERPLCALTPTEIRQWYGRAAGPDGPGPSTAAKCYRLLRTILGTAVEDGLIARNPCVIKGGGIERSTERPVASFEEIEALADAVGPRYRALVLTAAYTGLRLGELLGLTRKHVDLRSQTVTVVQQRQILGDGTELLAPPKSAAGRRTVSLPETLTTELADHLEAFTPAGDDAFVFVGERSQPLTRRVWQERWNDARRKLGLEHLHFHDLRHTGNTIAAATGASTRDLMARLGHSSPQAALRYQHATKEWDIRIASAIEDILERRRTQGHGGGCAIDVP